MTSRLQNLRNKTVGIVGLGPRTGVSLVKFLCAQGSKVIAYDERQESELGESLNALQGLSYQLETGAKEPTLLDSAELLVVSPGVPIHRSYLGKARSRNIPVWSEVELASQRISSPLLAVTGSNGKSTTTSLLAHLLSGWKNKVFSGGNLGRPLIDAVGESYDFVVVEVSSFQLEAVETLHPQVAVLTNISPNHLDRHGNMQTYAACKERMFSNLSAKDRAILNQDDPFCRSFARKIRAPVWMFSARPHLGADVLVKGNVIRLPGDETVSVDGFKLLGRHNLENAMAAVAGARAIGCPIDVICERLSSFQGLAHRLERVGIFDGIEYVNDSKSTNPISTIRALEAFNQPVVLLAGGRPKNFDYRALAVVVREKVKKVILFGEAAKEMAVAFVSIPHQVVDRLEEALEEARGLVSSGDVILFSPGNASFDQYQDYEERGRHFVSLVTGKSNG